MLLSYTRETVRLIRPKFSPDGSNFPLFFRVGSHVAQVGLGLITSSTRTTNSGCSCLIPPTSEVIGTYFQVRLHLQVSCVLQAVSGRGLLVRLPKEKDCCLLTAQF